MLLKLTNENIKSTSGFAKKNKYPAEVLNNSYSSLKCEMLGFLQLDSHCVVQSLFLCVNLFRKLFYAWFLVLVGKFKSKLLITWSAVCSGDNTEKRFFEFFFSGFSTPHMKRSFEIFD